MVERAGNYILEEYRLNLALHMICRFARLQGLECIGLSGVCLCLCSAKYRD